MSDETAHFFYIKQISRGETIRVYKGGWTFWRASDPGRRHRLFYSIPSGPFSILLRPRLGGRYIKSEMSNFL